MPTDPLSLVWAKSWPYSGEVESWLPLWQHLDDTADVAALLWDDWLAPSVRQTISAALPGGEADGRRMLVWLAGAHDVGKVSPAFAVQGRDLCRRMSTSGFLIGGSVHQDRSELRHEVVSAWALDTWLRQFDAGSGQRPGPRTQFTCVLAGHHGVFHRQDKVTSAGRRPALAGDGLWKETRGSLLDRAADRAGARDRIDAWLRVSMPRAALMLLTGAVIMADWIASDTELFPLLPFDVVPPVPDPTPVPGLRARTAWSRVSLGGGWVPGDVDGDVDDLFRERFAWAEDGARPEQRAVIETAQRMIAPGLLVIEAPMGIGKTEAGLVAAEVLAARSGASGVLVALPTQATSNAMFTRVKAWLDRVPDRSGHPEKALNLLHGKAGLNEDYAAMRSRRFDVAVHDQEPADQVEKKGRTVRAQSHEWFYGRKRAALAPFVVGTIDQVLFGALRVPHVMLRQLALAGKVVLIDEVHAADTYMAEFLDRAVEWLGACGSSVVLMSATLPAARRTALLTAYERGRRAHLEVQGAPAPVDLPAWCEEADRVLGGDIGYPVVCATDEGGPSVAVVPMSARSTEIDVRRLDDGLEALGDLLATQLSGGGCAVVVRNTVSRAQATATALEELFPGEVMVAHARFLAVDRVARDAELLRLFGPPGASTQRPVRRVVVATQVVEQSLDVDFDLMVTDIAPVDLLLQRTGRLHRHRRGHGEGDRSERVRRAQVWVTGVDWRSDPPVPDRGCTTVYGQWPLLASVAVLADHLDGRPVLLPSDIAPLVQRAYAAVVPVPPAWQEAADQAREADELRNDCRRSRADTFVIPGASPQGSLSGLNTANVGDADEDSPKGQAAVRDGSDSIEVVVVQTDGRGTDRVPDWVAEGDQRLPLRDYPVPYDQARLLAQCTVRLPPALCLAPKVFDAVVAELEEQYFGGWQGTPFLSGQLPLVLDDERQTVVHGYRLTYDVARGLLHERLEGVA